MNNMNFGARKNVGEWREELQLREFPEVELVSSVINLVSILL